MFLVGHGICWEYKVTYWDPSLCSSVRSPIACLSREDVQAREKKEEHQEE